MDKIISFVNRMKRLDIDVTLTQCYPWVFIYKINGKIVTENFMCDHGFTLIFLPIREGQKTEFTDIPKIFKLIRKYTKKEKKNA